MVIRPVSGERKDSTDVKTLTGRHQDTGSTPVFSSAHKLSPRTVRVNAVRYHSNFCELDRQAEYLATGELVALGNSLLWESMAALEQSPFFLRRLSAIRADKTSYIQFCE